MINQAENREINIENEIEEKNQISNSYKYISNIKLDIIKNKYNNEKIFHSYNNEYQIDKNINLSQNIANLKRKISELEEKLSDLKLKNGKLKRENFQIDSKINGIFFIGNKDGLSELTEDDSKDNNELTDLIKEKNDLQEINEKMLNMLTEKEIEIEDFQENFEKYKDEIKSEMEKYLDTIEELEKKNEILEEKVKKQENIDKKLDNVLNEYNSYKKRIDDSILEYIKKEEEMNKEIDEKETKISKMKINIQNLEIEIMKLQNQNEKNEKMVNEDKDVFEKILYENEKLKKDNNNLIKKMNQKEENCQNLIKRKEEEFNKLKQDFELYKSKNEKIKIDKAHEINLLKDKFSQINNVNNILIKKNDSLLKENQESKQKIYLIQKKLDKKSKDYKKLIYISKELLEKKNNLIQQYEEELEKISKEKNLLYQKNRELLNKIRETRRTHSTNLEDLLNDEEVYENNDENVNNKNNIKEINCENILFNLELKAIKDLISLGLNDMINLDDMEKELNLFKSQNKKLLEDFKLLKEKMKNQRYEEGVNELMNLIKNASKNKEENLYPSKSNILVNKDSTFQENNPIEQQVDSCTQLEKNEKKLYLDKIDKLNGDIASLKVKFLNKELENEILIAKYVNIIKSINNQCTENGFILNFNT